MLRAKGPRKGGERLLLGKRILDNPHIQNIGAEATQTASWPCCSHCFRAGCICAPFRHRSDSRAGARRFQEFYTKGGRPTILHVSFYKCMGRADLNLKLWQELLSMGCRLGECSQTVRVQVGFGTIENPICSA